MNNLFPILLLALLGSVCGLIGGGFFLINKRFSEKLSAYAIPFAAGVLLTVSLTHLIPESIEMSPLAPFIVLVAFLSSFLFEEVFTNIHHHAGHSHPARSHGSIPLVLIGDSIHNFIDGVTIAAAYMIDPNVGILVALATFLHEVPHEIGDFGVLMAHGWSAKSAFMANLFSALVTVIGAVLTVVLSDIFSPVIFIFLSVSAGIFLYLGASDFLPDISRLKRGNRWAKIFSLLLGVIIMLVVSSILEA